VNRLLNSVEDGARRKREERGQKGIGRKEKWGLGLLLGRLPAMVRPR